MLYVFVPKGFFPAAGHRHHHRSLGRAQDISFAEMVKLQHRLMDIVGKDPDVVAYGASVGGGAADQQRLRGHRPEAARSAQVQRRPDHRNVCAEVAQVSGGTLFLQAAQDINVGGRTTRTQYQYTLQDPDLDELNDWAPKLLAAMQKLPQLRDVASDQQTNGTMLVAGHRPRPGGPLRHPALS